MASEEVVRGYAEALFRIVQAEGELDRVEDELFRFGKLLDQHHELKQTLSDQTIDRVQRRKLLEDLLADKVSPHTLSLLIFVVDQGKARQLPQILDQVTQLAADARQSVVAEVRSAVPLNDNQRSELAVALSRATGKKVEIKTLVDPSIIGGVVAKVGDTVIDGSVRRRLEQLKDQVRG